MDGIHGHIFRFSPTATRILRTATPRLGLASENQTAQLALVLSLQQSTLPPERAWGEPTSRAKEMRGSTLVGRGGRSVSMCLLLAHRAGRSLNAPETITALRCHVEHGLRQIDSELANGGPAGAAARLADAFLLSPGSLGAPATAEGQQDARAAIRQWFEERTARSTGPPLVVIGFPSSGRVTQIRAAAFEAAPPAENAGIASMHWPLPVHSLSGTPASLERAAAYVADPTCDRAALADLGAWVVPMGSYSRDEVARVVAQYYRGWPLEVLRILALVGRLRPGRALAWARRLDNELEARSVTRPSEAVVLELMSDQWGVDAFGLTEHDRAMCRQAGESWAAWRSGKANAGRLGLGILDLEDHLRQLGWLGDEDALPLDWTRSGREAQNLWAAVAGVVEVSD